LSVYLSLLPLPAFSNEDEACIPDSVRDLRVICQFELDPKHPSSEGHSCGSCSTGECENPGICRGMAPNQKVKVVISGSFKFAAKEDGSIVGLQDSDKRWGAYADKGKHFTTICQQDESKWRKVGLVFKSGDRETCPRPTEKPKCAPSANDYKKGGVYTYDATAGKDGTLQISIHDDKFIDNGPNPFQPDGFYVRVLAVNPATASK
jgi:hypothetical protein